MKILKRLVAVASVASVLGFTLPLLSLAATTKTISSVSIRVGLEDIRIGDTLPSENSFDYKNSEGNYVYSNNSRYEVSDLDWVTSDNREMKIGSEPKMKVTLRATDPDEYAFKGGYRSSNVSIKGGDYVSSRRSGTDTLYVTFTFKPIKGTYESPEDADWRDTGFGYAKWSAAEYGSKAYDVYLYRGNTIIKKVEKLKANSYNFYPYMTREGTYSFKVRTVAYTEKEKKYGKKSDWTESTEMYLPKEKVSDGRGQNNNTIVTSNDVGWIRNGNIWYYRYPDGSYLRNSWSQINGRWYIFDTNGAMLTGWQQKNNLWYYLNNDGMMVTGWIKSNNVWYYMNQSSSTGVEGAMSIGWIWYKNNWYHTDTSGAMDEGWKQVDGNWYYFYPGEGSMAVNATISGFKIDANGVWHK